jgi:hypothetical protein
MRLDHMGHCLHVRAQPVGRTRLSLFRSCSAGGYRALVGPIRLAAVLFRPRRPLAVAFRDQQRYRLRIHRMHLLQLE